MSQSRAETFAEALIEARGRAGLNQKELAERAGVGRRSLSRWEFAECLPHPEQMHRLLRALQAAKPEVVPEVARAGGIEPEKFGLGPPGKRVVLESTAILDSIVCALADASDTTPARARRGLRAALQRMKEIDVTLANLDAMFATSTAENE